MFKLKNKIHLRNNSARFSFHSVCAAFILLASTVIFTNCSFLEDDGFFDKVENEVAVANADKMSIYLRHASIKFGKTQPADAALYQIKNNVEFSVTAMINEDYAFYRWAAFSTADFDTSKQHMSMVYTNDDDYYANYGSKELDSSVVKFENPTSETTTVRVLQTRSDIWIMPVVAIRPTIQGTFPKVSQTPVRNSKLRVQFSKPMDIESFTDNFIISQGTYASDFSLNETDITDKFQLEINEKKNLITFSFINTEEMFNPGVTVKIYFTEDIADVTGYKMEGSSSSRTLEWQIGTAVDTMPPLISEMTAGIEKDCAKFASTPTRDAKNATADLDNALYTEELLTHRVKDKVNIYVYAQDISKADGERLESDVLMLGFRAKSITDINGDALDSTQEGNFIADKIETYAGEENYSEIGGNFRTITGKKAGCLYTYDLSSLPDGLIQIEVYAYDSTGNDGLTGYDPEVDDENGVGNGPRSLFVVKDNRAPDLATELEKVKSSSAAAPFGWYNKLSIDTVEVYDTAANPIKDYGHPKLSALHDDIKWVFHLGEGTDWEVPATDEAWVSIKDKYKIGSATVEKDGPVSLSMRLMDDLGNMSDAVQISSVLYDNTEPAPQEALCTNSSGEAIKNSSSDRVLSQYIRLPFTEELCGVKIIGVNVKDPSGESVLSNFSDANIYYATGDDGELEAAGIDSSSATQIDDIFTAYDEHPSFFTDVKENLHVLDGSYKSGIFYINGIRLVPESKDSSSANGVYTVTVTLYDAALNKAAEKQIKFSYDTLAPVINRVIVQNVVPRTVYGSSEVTYWLPPAAYDSEKDAKYVSLEVTATENGSGINVITLGENAHLTAASAVSIEGTAVAAERYALNVDSNTITFSDYNSPDLYKTSGSITFVISNVRLDNPDTAEGNKVSVTLTDFVDNTGSNSHAGNFDLYIDSTSTSPIYAVHSDSTSPAIATEIATAAPAIADEKADSASDETTYATARIAKNYTDKENVELTLKLGAEGSGSGVKAFTLSNGAFTASTTITINDTTVLPSSEYTLEGGSVTFKNYVFTAADSFKFTNVALQSPDGSQSIGITATDFTGWNSAEVATNSIVLDTTAPVHGSTKWYVKEGVYGVSKSEVISNLALVVPFTEATSGVKIIKVEPKLHGAASSYATPFAATGFKLWYVASESDITSTLLDSASNVTFTPNGDYITIGTPQTSGVFVMLNLKVDDTLLDNSTYDINVHLVDSALNGSTAEDDANATIPLTADTTSPKIKRIFINRLIARTLPGESTVDSYWVSSEDFTSTTPNKVEVVFTIEEKASGIQSIVLGGNLKLTNSSVITCDVPSASTVTLEKGSDYTVSSDGTEIALADITVSLPKLINRDGDGSFTVKITNVELTGTSGEKTASVTLKDFALNSDANSTSSSISPIADDTTTTVSKIYVDTAAPAIYSAKLADRGGAAAIASRPDETNKTEARSGYTNENLVNLTLRTTYSSDGATKRSGIKKLVLTSGATFTAEGSDASKFYYKDLTATSNTSVSDTDAASDGTGYTEITGVTLSEDKTVAILPYSYACSNVCMFIVTNVELSGSDGSKTVSIRPLDLVGWQGSNYNNAITLDTTKPVWADKPFVPGTSNTAANIYPHSASDDNIIIDGEIYFYKDSASYTYLTAQFTETNHYALWSKYLTGTTSSFTDTTSASVVMNPSASYSITNAGYTNGYSYIFALMDQAGNISETTKIVRCVKDTGVKVDTTDSYAYSDNKLFQLHMRYVDDYESDTENENGSYKVFESDYVSGTFHLVANSSVGGVYDDTGCHGYPVYYNNHRNGTRGAKVVIDLTDYQEKTSSKSQSGIAYYAVNGDHENKPSANGETGDWNKWIPYDSTTMDIIAIYPPSAKTDAGCMRLWLKDNVGNVDSVRVKNGKAPTDEWDVWLYTTDDSTAVTPDVTQDALPNLGYGKVIPEGLYIDYNGTTQRRVYTGSPLVPNSANGDNRMFYTDSARFASSCNINRDENVNTCIVDTANKTINSTYYGVRVLLYPSTSRTSPDRATALQYFKDNPTLITYFGDGGTTISISDVPFPKYETNDEYFYIHVLCQDAVGNLQTKLLKYEIQPDQYTLGKANYARFKYDNKAPTVKVGGTDFTLSLTGSDGTYNGTFTNSQENFEKLCPTNAGHRVFYDATKGTKGTVYFASLDSIDTTLPYSDITGTNTSRRVDGLNDEINLRRPYFNIDIDEDDLFAFYYGAGYGHWSGNPTNGHIRDYGFDSGFNNWGLQTLWSDASDDYWMVLYNGTIPSSKGGYTFTGKVSVVLPNSLHTDTICLHLLDKVGHMVDIPMGEKDTIWENDKTAPTVDFTGIALNDSLGYYRMNDNTTAGTNAVKLTFSKLATDDIGDGIKVYIPVKYTPASGTETTFISDSASGIWGYSWTTDIADISVDENGPYLWFQGSDSALAIDTAKTFYVFDNVGNYTACTLTAAVDDIKPEITMEFTPYEKSSTIKFNYGKIYDVAGNRFYECSDSTTKITSSPYGGRGHDVNTRETPYTLYSNAKASATGTEGYILGTFKAKDQTRNDAANSYTTYSGTITQVDVTTYIKTSAGYSAGISANAYLPALTTEGDLSYLSMPIYLDGNGNSASDGVVTGFLGKLYEITIRDTGGNATTVWLEVLRDREGPSLLIDIGGVRGDVTGSSTKNRYYNTLDISITANDAGVGSDKYSVLGGTSASTVLNVGGEAENTLPEETAVTLTTDEIPGLSSDKLAIKAYDKLGNASVTYLDGSSSASSSFTWIKDTDLPNITGSVLKSGNSVTYAHNTATTGTSDGEGKLFYVLNRWTDGAKNPITITVTSNDSTGVVKGYFVSDTELSAYASQTLTTGNDIPITPKDYLPSNYETSGEKNGTAYLYAVDYAGNMSRAYKISIGKSTDEPKIENDDIHLHNYVETDDCVYFNNETTIDFTVTATKNPITKYGLYIWANYDLPIPGTEVSSGINHPAGTAKSYTISLTNFEKNPLDNGNIILPYVQANDHVNNAIWVYPFGDKCWYYDNTTGTPSFESIPTDSASIAFKKEGENKVYYKTNGTSAQTFSVNAKFPDDPVGMKGYKIQLGDGTLSGVKEFSEAIAPATEGVRPVSVEVPAGTTDGETVKIYAVDALGNVGTTPLSFEIHELTNASNVVKVTDVTKDSGNKFDVKNADETSIVTVYVNKDVTKLTVTPVAGNDIVTTTGFVLKEGDDFGTVSEGETIDIDISTDLPSDASGSKVYKIYAVNSLGLYSSTPYQLTVIRDIAGPDVTKITLEAPEGASAKLVTEKDADDNDVTNFYYNSDAIKISSVTAEDAAISSEIAGSGLVAKYLVKATKDVVEDDMLSGEDLVLGRQTGAASGIYIAAIDKLGNISYKALSDVLITLGTATDKTVTSFIYDADKPENVNSIKYDDKVVGTDDISGAGLYFDVPNPTKNEVKLYYSPTVLGESVTYIEITPSSPSTDVIGYYVSQDGSDYSGKAYMGATVNVKLSNKAARIFAVDKAGNVSENRYKITLVEDEAAAETFDQILGDYANGLVFSGYDNAVGNNYVTNYYSSDFELKLKLKASNTPIVAYAIVAGGSATAPANDSDAWKEVSLTPSEGEKEIGIDLGEISEIHKVCALWLKDATGNVQAYNNPKSSLNELGRPSTVENDLKYAWWMAYKKPESMPLSLTAGDKSLKISGFNAQFPVKALKFKNTSISESGMEISKIKAYIAEDTSYEISAKNDDVKKFKKGDDGTYTICFKNDYAYIVKELEITFTKGNLYFGKDASVTVTSSLNNEDEVEHSIAPSVTPWYEKATVTVGEGGEAVTTSTLTVHGLISDYKMKYLTFPELNKDAVTLVSVKSGDTDLQGTQLKIDWSDNYIIQFTNPVAKDSVTIEFSSELTDALTANLTSVEQASTQDDKVLFTLLDSEPAGSDPAPSIFGRFFDNVSSGISSIFTGRSMTHEERMALKEAKAAKKAALAAEKAAKKAAKKAARDAKKSAELASSEQGQSWTGLSGEFDSASSELDSAVSKMKSNASEVTSEANVSSKKSVLKVKSAKKTGASSAHEASLADSGESRNPARTWIYILGAFVALGACGGAGTVLVKKLRRK